jgi:hypothetical protein
MEPDLATQAGTVLKALPLRMAVLEGSAAQARTQQRAQEPPICVCLAARDGTALRAPLRVKELVLVMRVGTALQHPLQVKELVLVMRAGTALRAPL